MVGDNDWLVDDSEENAFELLLQDLPGAPKATCVASSAIQADISSLITPRTPERARQSPEGSFFIPPSAPGMPSTIDDLTDVPSASGAPTAAPPKPRPRPRVVIRKLPPSDRNTSVASTSFSHISDPPISATRTNDSIQSTSATPFGISESVEDIYSSLDIAERAKMRSRKSQTARKAIHQVQDVIELTSDEDELTLKPKKRQKKQGSPKPKAQTKPRPKPTLKVKQPVVPPSGSPSSRTEIRDPQPAPPAQPASSQLPASTLPTIPPSTPPQAGELSPLSSPLVPTRKRKRIRHLITEEDDEMDTIGGNLTRASPSSTMPPPFFASSSSSAPTDSGIEIAPADSLGDRSKKVSSSKKGTIPKKQNKGKKGKKAEIAVDETVEVSARTTQEHCTPSMSHNSSFAEESHSPAIKNTIPTEKAKGERILAKTGEAGAIDCCEEEELIPPSKSNTGRTPPGGGGERVRSKKNSRPHELNPPKRDPPPESTSTPDSRVRGFSVKPKSTPMSELIRRVNSHPSSPFPNAAQTYSPSLKSSRTMLSKIAPLHPNRRSPPPPLPRPPPPRKSKKQLEMEERIEEELAETIEGWSCLTDEERRTLRKARIDAELGYE